MLRVLHPVNVRQERLYIFDVLLREFLGLEYEAFPISDERQEVRLMMRDDPLDRELVLADVFFQMAEDTWLTEEGLPRQPLEVWDVSRLAVGGRLVSGLLPVIYGQRLATGGFWEETETSIRMGADLFGSSFFMLTRWEEVANPTRDGRERFPAWASLAFQEGFLMRPIVNEYVEVLWWALQKLWPGLERKCRAFHVYVSHDVDWPFCGLRRTLQQMLKSVAGDVVKRKSLTLAARRIGSYVRGRRGNFDADLYNTFDRIMEWSERQGLQSAFYFITGHSGGEIDGVYALTDPWIRKLMRQIHARGHEIGLHPSYGTFREPERIEREFANLQQALQEEGIVQREIGGRQHYLRWENPVTWRAWEQAGLAYDSTLSYADHIGFRCGTCYEYPVFDLQTRQALKLRERPLVVMEQAFLGDQYMNLTQEQALQEVSLLKERCRRFDGNFTLLWHNDQLVMERDVVLYQNMVGGG